jgi:hypothetical protein
MTSYQIDAPVSPIGVRQVPQREIRLATNGALLAAGEPRYATLAEYVAQFAAPLSQLRGVGLMSFYDPLAPDCTLLLECQPEEWCRRCGDSVDECSCPF